MKKSYLLGIIAVVLIVSVGLYLGMSSNDDDMMAKEEMTEDVMEKEDAMTTADTMEKEDAMTTEDTMEKEDDMKKEDSMSDSADKMMNDGEMAPAFELMSIMDEKVMLSSLKGEKVYVKFWASWCSICLAGLDELDELSMSEDIMVYTIVAPGHNGEQDKEEFIEWFDGLGYNNIKVLFDETGDIQKEYGIRGFPTSVYIGSDGVLVKTMPGHTSNEMVLDTFEDIK